MLRSFIFDVHKIKVPFYLLSTGYNKRLRKLKKKRKKSVSFKVEVDCAIQRSCFFFPFSSRVCSSKLMLALSNNTYRYNLEHSYVCVPAQSRFETSINSNSRVCKIFPRGIITQLQAFTSNQLHPNRRLPPLLTSCFRSLYC